MPLTPGDGSSLGISEASGDPLPDGSDSMADIVGIEYWEAWRALLDPTEEGGYRRPESELAGSPFPGMLSYLSRLPTRVEGDPGIANIDTGYRLTTDAPPDGGVEPDDIIVRQRTSERYRVLRARTEDGDYVIYLEMGATPARL